MEEKYIQKVIEIEQRSKSNTKRIDEQDKKIDELSDVYLALTKVDNRVSNVEKNVDEIKADVKEIKEKPSKRYDQITSLIITRHSNSYTGFFISKIRVVRR